MMTAENLYDSTFEGLNLDDNEHLIPKIMKEFAIYHVKQALEAAANKVNNEADDLERWSNSKGEIWIKNVELKSILTAYDTENIE